MKTFLTLAILAGSFFATSSAFAPASSLTTHQRTSSVAMAATESDELTELYNQQITNEFQACQLYMAASIEADRRNLVGMASYFRDESEEERGHAKEFIDFANKRNIPIKLQALKAPAASFSSTYELWETLVNAEKENTKALLHLADAAQKNNDHALTAFLQPFHMEQVNSEDALDTILSKVKDEQQTPGLLRILDQELQAATQANA